MPQAAAVEIAKATMRAVTHRERFHCGAGHVDPVGLYGLSVIRILKLPLAFVRGRGRAAKRGRGSFRDTACREHFQFVQTTECQAG